jgi:glucose/mannose-6-phosphate isomerase
LQEKIKELIKTFPKQISEGIKESKILIKDSDKIENIIVSGMGGSAISGTILRDTIDIKIPFVINRNYDIPSYVNSKTLFFAVSYSGNTEETISAVQHARIKNAKIVAMTSGGKLSEIAKKYEMPLINMPKGMIPRFTVIFQIFAMMHVLHNTGIIKLNKKDIEDAISALKKDYSTISEEIAKKLRDKITLIYTSPKIKKIGVYWKQALNENAKVHAFHSTFPELNHNELEAYSKKIENFHVIILRDENENIRINKRIELSKEIIKSSKVPISEINVKGDSRIIKICSAILLGATISAELADQIETDAEETLIINKFKRDLSS